jgi:hypothetical protein
MIERRRVQLVRQPAHAFAERLRPLEHPRKLAADIGLSRGHVLAELVHIDRDQRDLLADVIVQLTRDPPAFILLRAQQARGQPRRGTRSYSRGNWHLTQWFLRCGRRTVEDARRLALAAGIHRSTEEDIMRTHRTLLPLLAVVAAIATGGALLSAETNSYFDKSYDFKPLRTYDFKTQHRLSSDPIANNRIWADEIRNEIAGKLRATGFQEAPNGKADFLVAYYLGLKERYTSTILGYGFPGRGRRFGWGWGGADIWNIPYTESTLIVDIIDGQTNQLIWRGYDTNTLDMKRPDKRLDKAVDTLVKRFLKDSKRAMTS